MIDNSVNIIEAKLLLENARQSQEHYFKAILQIIDRLEQGEK